MKISIEHANAPGVHELLAASDAFHAELYPPEGTFLLDVSALLEATVTVVVARLDGVAVGMGALVPHAHYAEIKRMFVQPEARGTGAADGIVRSLEAVARDQHVERLQLETGPLQPAAIAFYQRNGFEPIELFGEYVGCEWSVCFAKNL